MKYIEYGYEQMANGKWMVVKRESLVYTCIGWYGNNLTKEDAYKMAKDLNRSEPQDFTGRT